MLYRIDRENRNNVYLDRLSLSAKFVSGKHHITYKLQDVKYSLFNFQDFITGRGG